MEGFFECEWKALTPVTSNGPKELSGHRATNWKGQKEHSVRYSERKRPKSGQREGDMLSAAVGSAGLRTDS